MSVSSNGVVESRNCYKTQKKFRKRRANTFQHKWNHENEIGKIYHMQMRKQERMKETKTR